jgi:hypothetical protein
MLNNVRKDEGIETVTQKVFTTIQGMAHFRKRLRRGSRSDDPWPVHTDFVG